MTSFPSILESIDDLTLPQIDLLLSRSKHFKNGSHFVPFEIGPRPIIATSFLENSTRTKHSFAVAIHRIGGHYIDFNAESSSLKKGESLEETFLTLHAQGVDLCVLRTSVSHQLSEFKNRPPIKIINGGDGINEHPTQGLLDLMTLLEIFSDLNGKTISIMGDLIHSRVGHSLIKLLPQFGANIILFGPKHFLPELSNFKNLSKNVTIETHRETAIKKSDALYLLRIQKERHGEHVAEMTNYLDHFGVSYQLLQDLKKEIPVLHPGPANIGVEINLPLVKSPLYQGYLQVKNSVPMRMAILEAMLLNRDQNIGC